MTTYSAVQVLIPSLHKRAKQLTKMLEALHTQTHLPMRICVCLDGPWPTRPHVSTTTAPIFYHDHGGEYRGSGGRWSHPDLLDLTTLVLDDDFELQPNVIELSLKHLVEHDADVLTWCGWSYDGKQSSAYEGDWPKEAFKAGYFGLGAVMLSGYALAEIRNLAEVPSMAPFFGFGGYDEYAINAHCYLSEKKVICPAGDRPLLPASKVSADGSYPKHEPEWHAQRDYLADLNGYYPSSKLFEGRIALFDGPAMDRYLAKYRELQEL